MPLTEEVETELGGGATDTPIEQADSSSGSLKSYDDTQLSANYPGDGASPVRKKRKSVQFAVMGGEGDSNVSAGSGDSASVGGEGVRRVEGVTECMGRVSDELKHLLLKWKEGLLESESFETFCPTRIDELLKEALEVEEQLKQQKKDLKKRLEGISQTLFNLNNS
ncbi:uncharacterized protein LOC135347980 [Halichondria panicea]|uniref:uncharacterized protein LOC135347980 n=1 Tax=Halichondria panicea TaxID=6063 RepID=UPI00312B671D